MTPEPDTEDHHHKRKRARLWLVLAFVALVIALIVVPPLISINRYQKRITELVSQAMHRPVRLSGVELRILPRPGFVLSDFTVASDPAFGSEPVLHAATVSASVRLASLWRGQLQISRISVDEASLNLVRNADGVWNIDDLFHTAAEKQHGAGGKSVPLPYMEATDSRINIKLGAEKLPFSLMNSDASLWQESDDAWRVRLRGQPARTDVSLDMADTGIVRLEATLHPASQLAQMPLQVDLDWREAQLGQLSRLLLGSDQGWRGDLTGELHLKGTLESSRINTRLRASGVHRAEFAPAAPLDFDATCGFLFRSSERDFNDIRCESPVGNGRARLTGEMHGGASPKLTLALDRIPTQLGLDLLRTMRSDLDPAIQAAGTVSGSMAYDPTANSPVHTSPHGRTTHAAHATAPTLTGSFSVKGLTVSGGALSNPVQIGGMTIGPAPESDGPAALLVSATVPAGGETPLALTARLQMSGFRADLRGPAALPRLREFAQVAGVPQAAVLKQLTGEAADLDVSAQAPWLSVEDASPIVGPTPGTLSGSVAFHDVKWNSGFLPTPVEFPSATLQLEDGGLHWDPVGFSFGPLHGTATLFVPPACDSPEECEPRFTVQLGTLDAAALQASLLGARGSGSVLSDLLSHLSPSSKPAWPAMQGTVEAATIRLGPLSLTNAAADLRVTPTGAELSSFDAVFLGGKLHGAGSMETGDRPTYNLNATVIGLAPAQASKLFNMTWKGGPIRGGGQLELSGYTGRDFSSTAKGTLHFDWEHGSVAASDNVAVPAPLSRFDAWTSDVAVAGGKAVLQDSTVKHGAKKSPVQATITFGVPAHLRFASARPASQPDHVPASTSR